MKTEEKKMQQQPRNPYNSPRLAVHGNVEKLTGGGTGKKGEGKGKNKSALTRPPRP
jgi:hypothetical protein